MKTIQVWRLASIACVLGMMTACDKNDEDDIKTNQTQLHIKLTDAPIAGVREVWVELKDIQTLASDTGSWTSVPSVQTGLYNLLALSNGRDTTLADVLVPSGKLQQVRILLGENNYIIDDAGQKISLNTSPAVDDGIEVTVGADLVSNNTFNLLLDFDAGKSISVDGSGNLNLTPSISVVPETPVGGKVQGYVSPDSILTSVWALMGTDTVASTTTDNGNYLFRDLPVGSYNLAFLPLSDSFNIASKTIAISVGQTAVIDTVQLEHK